ncbi:MAG: creatininase family protein [Microbacterium sp.]|uniref:creatininase family protein n=1 Tax=Microbacterium sp. TaxID=51671 RepID=UPI001AC28655|nr:creatininase family protein [Microbacterium sp.]MBN9176532.1 creatininase family protein [Microbacterium sp.]
MSTPSPAAIERLSPDEIERRLAVASVAYLPLGSLEFHGPHLPIGLDALTAQGLCLAAAEQHGGVVLPPYYQAVGGEHARYPWTLMSDRPDAIEALLGEALARLDELGVHRAILFSGHFADAQRELIERVADRWNARGSGLRAVARTLGQAPEPPVLPDHAGRFESLVLHAVAPELVHVDLLPDAATHPAPASEDPYGHGRHHGDHPLHGIFGADPRGLDIDAAAPLFAHLTAWVATLARAD